MIALGRGLLGPIHSCLFKIIEANVVVEVAAVEGIELEAQACLDWKDFKEEAGCTIDLRLGLRRVEEECHGNRC